MDQDGVRYRAAVVPEEVLPERRLRSLLALGLVGYRREEDGERVHAPALDLVGQGIHRGEVVIDPEGAGEQYPYGHLRGIEGPEVILLRDVPVHPLMIDAVLPLGLRFRGHGIGLPEPVRRVQHHPPVVLRPAGGRVPADLPVFIVPPSEEVAVHQRDLGVAAEQQHPPGAFLQRLPVAVEALEAAGVRHAPEVDEVRLLRAVLQLLVCEDVVVRFLRVDRIDIGLDPQFPELLRRGCEHLRVSRLQRQDDDSHLHSWMICTTLRKRCLTGRYRPRSIHDCPFCSGASYLSPLDDGPAQAGPLPERPLRRRSARSGPEQFALMSIE